jgi:hypothetical protein
MTLQGLDDRIMKPTQRCSDWVHTWTGFDSIEQKRWVAGICAVGWLGVILYRLRTWHFFDPIAALLLVANFTACCFETEIDAQIRSECQRGYRNRRRVDPVRRASRPLFLCVAVLVTVNPRPTPFCLLIVFCSAVGELLAACDVQTPRTGRIREALSKLATVLKPAGEMA